MKLYQARKIAQCSRSAHRSTTARGCHAFFPLGARSKIAAAASMQQAAAATSTATDLVQQLMNYQYTAKLPDGGTLVIQALQPEWLVRREGMPFSGTDRV